MCDIGSRTNYAIFPIDRHRQRMWLYEAKGKNIPRTRFPRWRRLLTWFTAKLGEDRKLNEPAVRQQARVALARHLSEPGVLLRMATVQPGCRLRVQMRTVIKSCSAVWEFTTIYVTMTRRRMAISDVSRLSKRAR